MPGNHHHVQSVPETIHWGYFDATLPPVLWIDSGDTVTIDCLSGEPADLPEHGAEVGSSRRPAGKPPRMATSAGPCDSPAVVRVSVTRVSLGRPS